MADITAQLADGTTLSFPEGTPDSVIDRTVKTETARANVERENAKGPYTPPEHRGSFLSDAGNFVKGAVTAPFKGAWGVGEGLGEAAGHSLTGNHVQAAKRLLQLGKDTVSSVADPFEHGGEMAAEAAGINRYAPNVVDEDRIAQTEEGMGAFSTGLAMGVRGMKSPGLTYKGVPMAPEEVLRSKAKSIQENAAKRPDMAISNATSVPSAVARGTRQVVNAALDARSPLYNKAAQIIENQRAPLTYQAPNLGAPNTPDAVRAPRFQEPVVDAARNVMEGRYTDEMAAANAAASAEPAALMPVNPDVVSMQQQLRPAGGAAQKWVARNATEAYELMPELRDVPYGEGLRVRATNAFKNFEANMKAAQASVPPETMVPKAPLAEALLEVKADAALANRPAVLRVLDKLDDLPPNIRWQDFLDVKEGIRKSPSFGTDPFVRRAYGKFMDAASKVSPELAKANKDFSVAMRYLEHAKIDPVSGQFLKAPR